MKIMALVNHDRVTVSSGKGKYSPEGTRSKGGRRVVIKLIRLVDVAQERRKLNNLGSRGGRRASGGHVRRNGVLDRIHVYAVRVTAIQMMIARVDAE